MTAGEDTSRQGQARRHGRRLPAVVLVALCLLPAVQTAVAVYLEFVPAVTYPLLKAAILLTPLVAWRLCRRRIGAALTDIGLRRTNCLRGLVLGLALLGVILGGYYLLLHDLIDPAPVARKARTALGGAAAVPGGFLALAAGITFANSLLEEYYWRGFILDEWLRRPAGSAGRGQAARACDAARPRCALPGRLRACLLGAGFFGVHHAFVLLPAVPPGLVALGTLATVVAAFVWSWLRSGGWSLWDCYLSHVLADVGCLWVAWDLVSRGASAA